MNTLPSGEYIYVGIADATASLALNLGGDSHGRSYSSVNGWKWENNTHATYSNNYNASDVIGVCVDITDGTLTFLLDNTNKGVAFSDLPSLTGPIYAAVGSVAAQTDVVTAHFTAASLTYAPPSGYTAWG
jgi:hypothetical protein